MKAKRMGLAAGLTLAVFLTLLLHTGLFTQFGQWLRTLSLSGRGGNAGCCTCCWPAPWWEGPPA